MKNNMFLLAHNVVFVSGAYCGAIYDFNTGNVYSINHETKTFLQTLKNSKKPSNAEQANYIELLKSNSLFDAIYFGKSFKRKKPRFNRFNTVWLELTMSCNCKCLHCYEGKEHKKVNDPLQLDDWFNVIEQIKLLGARKIILIGGEPCLHKNLIQIIEKIYSSNIDILLFTNATLLSEELLNAIIKYNVKVKASIYGHTAEVHDKITQNVGSFNKLCNNISTLLKHNIAVFPSVVIMKENQDYIDDIKNFINTLGLQWNGYDIVREVGCGKGAQHFVNDVIKNCKVRSAPSFSANKKFFINSIYFNNCWNKKIVISENGDVLPCVFARAEICGNIKNNTIDEIINMRLSNYWNYNFSNITTCRDCEYRFACKDCRPVAMANVGNLNAHTEYCKYNPYLGEWNE